MNGITIVNKVYLTVGMILGWLAIVGQAYLIIANRTVSIIDTIIRFFSFYTILTNILVALCFTAMLFKPHPSREGFFSKPTTLSAIAMYITVVGLVYNLVLRFLWQPHGLQFVVDELLHSVMPILFVLYWILYVRKNELQWKFIPYWLIYPIVYTVYILIRGLISGNYPYSFIDASILSPIEVIINILLLTGVFTFFSLLFVGIGKLSRTK